MLGLKGLLKSLDEIVDVERHTALHSPIHGIDPRVKVLTTLLLVSTAILIRSIVSMLFLFCLVMLIALASRLPMRSYLGRATFFIPFFAGIIALPMVFMTPGAQFFTFNLLGADLVATKEGISVAAHFVFRVWLCVAATILLILTTEFPRLVRGLRGLGVPKVFAMMLLITFRYIQLYVNEALRMLRAKEARSFGRVGVVRGLRIGGSLVGTLFTRSYERGERVYHAMLARGFDGETRLFNDLRLRLTDLAFGLLLALTSVALVLFDAGVIFPGLVGQLSGTLNSLISW